MGLPVRELQRLALAIIIIRSRRLWETNRMALTRLLSMLQESVIASQALEAAIDLSTQVLLSSIHTGEHQMRTEHQMQPQLLVEILRRCTGDARVQNTLQSVPLLSGLNDACVCRLLAYCDALSRPHRKEFDAVMVSAFDGSGEDVAVRVSALLCHMRDHVPSETLLRKLLEAIHSGDAALVLAGVSMVRYLSIPEAMLNSFLDALSPARMACL